MSAAIHLSDVTLTYDRYPAVEHVTGSFAAGSLTAITGANGAGKSTLLKAIAGMLSPISGHIRYEGDDKTIAYLPQAAALQRDFPMSVLHMVATGYWQRSGSFKTITPYMKAAVAYALEEVGLAGFARHDLASLSAGQFQRALFARLLIQNASVILLDEPFTAVDADTTVDLLNIIARWHQEGRTVIAILHDIEQIKTHFPDCLLLARRVIAWGESVEALSPENLAKTYTSFTPTAIREYA